jgi:hypothetical protein
MAGPSTTELEPGWAPGAPGSPGSHEWRQPETAPRLRFRRVGVLAPLAWCAEIHRGDPHVDVVHGRMVEVAPTGFFEGVWDGSFADFDFATSCTTMGSGAVLAGERIQFVAPSHTYESLCTVVDQDRAWISNSIAFALAMADDAPDVDYPWYHRDLLDLQRRGITGDQALSLPTTRGRRCLLYAATDVVVDRDLVITTRARPQLPVPADFATYRADLADAVAALVRNATDPARRHPLTLATTTSSGYDSTATSVLAAEAGVTEAITFEIDAPRAHTDSGRAIAESLGLRVHPYRARDWTVLPECPELEFVACASGWAMLPLALLADDWSESLVFLGSLGDDLWPRDGQRVGNSLARPEEYEPAAAGLREFRLRTGIVFVHVPTIGAIHADAIQAIGRSAEMAPWTLHNQYDRPVPRRIVEEAGIPRRAFGQTEWKTIDAQTPEIVDRLHRSSFATFIAANAPRLTRPRRWRLTIEWSWGEATLRAGFRFVCRWWGRAQQLRLRPLERMARAAATSIVRWQWHRSLPVLYTFHWGTLELAQRYHAAVDADRSRAPR